MYNNSGMKEFVDGLISASELFLRVLTRFDTLIQAPWFNIHSSSFKGFL